jgi:PAS domain-containing protein
MLAFNGGAALRAAERSQSEIGVLTLADGRIVAADAGTRRLLGATAARQVLGRPLADFVAPGSADAGPPDEARADLITVVRLDGELMVSEWSARPSCWKGREVTRFTLSPVDGDPRRIERLATGCASPADAVITADIHFGIRSFSSGAEQIYRRREADVLHCCLTDVLTIGNSFDRELDLAVHRLRRSGRWDGRGVQRRSDGGRFPALVSATVVRDAGGRDLGTVWVIRVTSGAGSPA